MPDFGGVIRYEQEAELRPGKYNMVLEISGCREAVQAFKRADCGNPGIIPPHLYD